MVFVLFIPATAGAKEKGKKNTWRWHIESELASEYETNVFGLTTSGKGRVETQSQTNIDNGRLKNMDSIDDFAVVPEVKVVASRKTPLGRFSIEPTASYHQYTMNPALSYPELGVTLRQNLPGHSSVSLRADGAIGVFKRNYFDDSVGTGVIDKADRIYRTGRYDDWDIRVEYERRLWKGSKKHRKKAKKTLIWPMELEGKLKSEYGQRRFRKHFSNRDSDTWNAKASLGADMGRFVDLELGYRFAMLFARGDREAVLLDEPDLGIDLNGDFDSNDDNVRDDVKIDRSRNEHKIGMTMKVKPFDRVKSWVSYDFRLLDYESNEDMDLSHRGRRDQVHAVGAGVSWKFAKRWVASAETELAFRNTNRDASLLGDEDSEKQSTLVRVSVGTRF
ncbi:MAG: hypothetical protein QF570_19070 [Myxococcota bacterium]|nr:hypothetical protein [Myxococcota bacterium]